MKWQSSRRFSRSLVAFCFSLAFLSLWSSLCFADVTLTDEQYKTIETALTDSDKALQLAQDRSNQQQQTIGKLQTIISEQATTLNRQQQTLQQSATTLAGLGEELPKLSQSFDKAIAEERTQATKWKIAGAASAVVSAAAAGLAIGGPVGALIGAGVGLLVVGIVAIVK